MLAEFFNSHRRIQALRDGPAGPLLESFARSLSDAGYATSTARAHLRAAEHFIYWIEKHSIAIRDANEQVLARFNDHLKRCRCRHYAHAMEMEVFCGAHLFTCHLRHAGIIAASSPKQLPTPELLESFARWMRKQRGICDATLYNYNVHLRELLHRLGNEPTRLQPSTLRSFLLDRSRSGTWATAKTCATALRMFLRFLTANGDCAVGLEAAIPTVAHWRLATLPRYLQPEAVERLIASCDQSSAIGRRNRAILLLLARLALRAGDITHLRLSDIDWEKASIQVCGKGLRQTELPLTQEVGQAIVNYLQNGRPRCKADIVFVRYQAPFRCLSSAAISMIVARALRQAGIVRPSRGAAHLLRHSAATSMLWQGASLEEIARLLRHRSIETTQIYAKVDVRTLRQIAQPWPRVQPC